MPRISDTVKTSARASYLEIRGYRMPFRKVWSEDKGCFLVRDESQCDNVGGLVLARYITPKERRAKRIRAVSKKLPNMLAYLVLVKYGMPRTGRGHYDGFPGQGTRRG